MYGFEIHHRNNGISSAACGKFATPEEAKTAGESMISRVEKETGRSNDQLQMKVEVVEGDFPE
jgi:hypothetical protein